MVTEFEARINAHDVDGIARWQVFADNEPIRQIMARLARRETRYSRRLRTLTF